MDRYCFEIGEYYGRRDTLRVGWFCVPRGIVLMAILYMFSVDTTMYKVFINVLFEKPKTVLF